jgi:hypothetical protein
MRVLTGLGTEAYALRLRDALAEVQANGNGTAKFNGSAGEDSTWT